MKYSKSFSFGEADGPFECDIKGCTGSAWFACLTEAEHKSLPEDSGPVAVSYIMKTKDFGIFLCDEHVSGRVVFLNER